MDLKTLLGFVGVVYWELLAEALNKQTRCCLVPWVCRRSQQVEPEAVGCAGEFIAPRVVSACLFFRNLVGKCAVLRGLRQECGVLPDIFLDGRQL